MKPSRALYMVAGAALCAAAIAQTINEAAPYIVATITLIAALVFDSNEA